MRYYIWNMKKYTYLSFILVVLVSITGHAQDPSFLQPFANPLYLNPAFAGTGTNQRIGLNYQNIYPSNDVTYNASYDRNFIDSNNGIGFLVNQEHWGQNQEYTTSNYGLIYSHQFHIKSFTLSTGGEASYRNVSLDESKIVDNYFDNIEPARDFIYSGPTLLRNSVSEADFSAGILGYGKNYFAGFSIDHPTQPDESFYEGEDLLPIKYTANAGVVANVRKITFSMTSLFEKQGTYNQEVEEVYASVLHLTARVGFRRENVGDNFADEMIFTIGYQYKLLRLGYSYNFMLPGAPINWEQTNEASLSVLLPYSNSKRKKVTGINCPLF